MRLYKPPLPTPAAIEASFLAMAEHGFRVEGELIWTYSFTHWSGHRLLDLRWRLEDMGLQHAGTEDASSTQVAGAAPLVRLSMSERRPHTTASLRERLADLAQLAVALDVDYEGWEASRLPYLGQHEATILPVTERRPSDYAPLGRLARELSGSVPKGTSRLLLRRLAKVPLAPADLVGWAVKALESGFDSQALRVLAGLDLEGPANGFEADEQFRAAFTELKLAQPTEEALLHAVTSDVVAEILSGDVSPQGGVETIHREVLSPFSHPEQLMSWCYLWEGLDPVTYSSLEDRELDEAIRSAATRWAAGEQ